MDAKETVREEEIDEFLSDNEAGESKRRLSESGCPSESVSVDGPGSPDGLPVDRGWAWVVLIGAVVSMTFVLGTWRTTGIFFILYQEKFRSSATMTSLISSISNAAFSITGPLTMTAGLQVMSNRQVVIVGAALGFISYVIIAVSNHIGLVIFSQGIIQGIGYGMIEPCVVSMVTRHFKKRRSLANSLTAASGSLGGFVLPLLVTYLNRFYGFFGCMILLAAINLNVGAIALVFRPESYYIQRSKNNKKSALLPSSNLEKDKVSPTTTVNQTILKYFNYKLFLDPLFVMFQVSFFLLTGGIFIIMYLSPPMAKDFGITETNIALIVTVFAIVDLCFRIIMGFLADLGFCRRSTLMAISLLIFGINSHLARFYISTFEMFLVFSIIQGAAGAPVMALYPGIIVDYLTVKHLDSAIGFATFGLGLASALFIYLGGVLRDATGSFIVGLHVSGTITIAGSVMMMCLPVVEKKMKRKSDIDECQISL